MTLLTPFRPRTRNAEIVRPTRPGDRIRLVVAVVVTLVALVALVVLAVTRPASPSLPGPAPTLHTEQAPAKQAPAKQAPATQAPAKQAPAKQAPAKQAPAKQAPAAPPGLETQLHSYLAARPTTGAVEVRDLVTGRQYGYRAGKAYDSASVVKIAILAATLRHQEQQGRALTTREKSLLGRMVRESDNGATSTLWNRLGRGAALDRFFAKAGMTHTKAGPKGYWGLTQVTAADQVVLMAHLARPSALLTEAGRAYARKLMASVDPTQDWGVSAGPGRGVTVELKNGWLPRGRDGWAVHSVGHVRGKGRDYLIAVLTLHNKTENKGIATVEGVSKIVWRSLAPA